MAASGSIPMGPTFSLFEYGRLVHLLPLEIGGGHDEGTLLNGIVEGHFQFWPGLKSAGVTEVIQYPLYRACVLWLAGGDLEELKEMEAVVSAWAKEIGCRYTTIYGRDGWERALGYERLGSVMRKKL